MRKFLIGKGLMLGLMAALGVAAFAQGTQGVPQGGGSMPSNEGRHERMGRMGKHRGEMGREGGGHIRMFRELNLTDAQKGQFRALHEKSQQGTRAQREELRQLMQQRRQGGELTTEQETRARQLRTELRDINKRNESEMLSILTPEQRTQLQQKREEMKQRRREMRQNRGDEQKDEQP
ncbi:MAG: Spy/CpxP family protein refolding chaperone [Pyrinomonadaceae bacterium]